MFLAMKRVVAQVLPVWASNTLAKLGTAKTGNHGHNEHHAIDKAKSQCIISYTMSQPTKKPKTMTQLLKEAIVEADSFLGIQQVTGVTRQSLMKFVRGEQSLRLDLAEKLAAHFGIECVRRKAR